MKIQKKMEALPAKPLYMKKKPFFSSKEIIFRGEGRAMVFTISSRIQVIFLILLMLIGSWSFYSYHVYNRSGRIISTKDRQLGQSREAYLDLMTEFATLHKNVNSVVSSLGKGKNNDEKRLKQYQEQAEIIENKIKDLTKDNAWLSSDAVAERANLYEAMLQRDLAASERDEYKRKLTELNASVEDMRQVELEVFDKVKALSAKEVDKMKKALGEVNQALKEKGLYFNALSNKKKSSGGPYIPDNSILSKDKKMNDKVSAIFDNMEDWHYYKQVLQSTPIGKPVWSYWVTSEYGARLDPFKRSKSTHKGIDLASMTGNKIKIKAKGKVTQSAHVNGFGNLVVVDHGNGFVTKYAHLHKRYVKKGDVLDFDDAIGEVGSTGRSTGPHLHYEVLYRGVNIDPLPFVQAKI